MVVVSVGGELDSGTVVGASAPVAVGVAGVKGATVGATGGLVGAVVAVGGTAVGDGGGVVGDGASVGCAASVARTPASMVACTSTWLAGGGAPPHAARRINPQSRGMIAHRG